MSWRHFFLCHFMLLCWWGHCIIHWSSLPTAHWPSLHPMTIWCWPLSYIFIKLTLIFRETPCIIHCITCFSAALVCGQIPLMLAEPPSPFFGGLKFKVSKTPTWCFTDNLSNLPSWLFLVLLRLLMYWTSWHPFSLSKNIVVQPINLGEIQIWQVKPVSQTTCIKWLPALR